MGLAAFSLSNITNSLAEWLAEVLLLEGYLLYWPSLDALQTPAGIYPEYQRHHANTLLEVPEVAALLPTSRGVVTILDDDFSSPRYSTRPTDDGAVSASEDMPVPSIVVQVAHEPHGKYLGLGSRSRSRNASLTLFGLARDKPEQHFLVEVLRVALDDFAFINVLDHDNGTRDLVGSLEVHRAEVDTFQYPLGPSSRVFEFTASVGLRYDV